MESETKKCTYCEKKRNNNNECGPVKRVTDDIRMSYTVAAAPSITFNDFVFLLYLLSYSFFFCERKKLQKGNDWTENPIGLSPYVPFKRNCNSHQ